VRLTITVSSGGFFLPRAGAQPGLPINGPLGCAMVGLTAPHRRTEFDERCCERRELLDLLGYQVTICG
jgi:hypothetical protein